MVRQSLQNKPPGALKGIALVLSVLAALAAGSWAFSLLGQRIGSAATALFIAYGGAIAWLLLRYVVMGFHYTLDGGCLSIERTYGRRRRPVCDVYLGRVRAYGTVGEVEKRMGSAPRQIRATLWRCEHETLALWTQRSDGAAIVLIQPDDAMREALIAALKQR